MAERDQRAQQVLAAVCDQMIVRIHPQRIVEPRSQVLLPCSLRGDELFKTLNRLMTRQHPPAKACSACTGMPHNHLQMSLN